MQSEFALAPELTSDPSLMQIFEHFAYKAAPLNENAKPFDPDRPFFDYSISLNIPEIEKDFNEGYIAKHLPVNNSHPYLELFFESDFKSNEYTKKANFVEKPKPKLERKPFRIEAIIKIQRALGVRLRSEGIFQKSEEILESFINSDETNLNVEDVDVMYTEYEDFMNLCRDANYFLKKSSMRSSLGKYTYDRIQDYNKYKKNGRTS
jgi:hypothetical protein